MPESAEFLSTFNFEVILTPSGYGGDEDVTRAADFSDVSGLELTLEHTEIREGGYNVGVRRLIGKTSSPEIVLKRGMTRDAGFWQGRLKEPNVILLSDPVK